MVAGSSEDRIDFGVDQLVLQHGDFRGRSVKLSSTMGFIFTDRMPSENSREFSDGILSVKMNPIVEDNLTDRPLKSPC